MNKIKHVKQSQITGIRQYIGASDIPTLALLNIRFGSTPLNLYNVIKGIEPPWEGSDRTKVGSEIEPFILKWGLEKMEYDFDSTKFLVSRIKQKNKCKNLLSFTEASCPGMPFLKSHTDLLEIDEPFGMEAKSAGFFSAKRRDDPDTGYDDEDMSENGIPASVYLQVQTQMLCYDVDTWYVPVQIDTGITRLYGPIKPNVKTQEKIMALADRFWWNVTNDKPPKPESWEDIKKMFPDVRHGKQTIVSGIAMDKAIEMKERATAIRKKRKKLKDELEDIKNGIGLFMQDKQYLMSDAGKQIASRSVYPTYRLSGVKKMSEQLRESLERNGFISESIVDKLNF